MISLEAATRLVQTGDDVSQAFDAMIGVMNTYSHGVRTNFVINVVAKSPIRHEIVEQVIKYCTNNNDDDDDDEEFVLLPDAVPSLDATRLHVLRAFVISVKALKEDGVHIFNAYMRTKSRLFTSLLLKSAVHAPAFTNEMLLAASRTMVPADASALVSFALSRHPTAKIRHQLIVDMYEAGLGGITPDMVLRCGGVMEDMVSFIKHTHPNIPLVNWTTHADTYIRYLEDELIAHQHDPVARGKVMAAFEQRITNAGDLQIENAVRLMKVYERCAPIMTIINNINPDVAALFRIASEQGSITEPHTYAELQPYMPSVILKRMGMQRCVDWVFNQLLSPSLSFSLDVLMNVLEGGVFKSANVSRYVLSSTVLVRYFASINDLSTLVNTDDESNNNRQVFARISKFMITCVIGACVRPRLKHMYALVDAWYGMYARVSSSSLTPLKYHHHHHQWWTSFSDIFKPLVTSTRLPRTLLLSYQLDALQLLLQAPAAPAAPASKSMNFTHIINDCINNTIFTSNNNNNNNKEKEEEEKKNSSAVVKRAVVDMLLPLYTQAMDANSVDQWFGDLNRLKTEVKDTIITPLMGLVSRCGDHWSVLEAVIHWLWSQASRVYTGNDDGDEKNENEQVKYVCVVLKQQHTFVPINRQQRQAFAHELKEHAFTVYKQMVAYCVSMDDDDDRRNIIIDLWKKWWSLRVYDRKSWMNGGDFNTRYSQGRHNEMVMDVVNRLTRLQLVSTAVGKSTINEEISLLLRPLQFLVDQRLYRDDVHTLVCSLGVASRVFDYAKFDATICAQWLVQHRSSDIANEKVREFCQQQCLGVKDEYERLGMYTSLITRSLSSSLHEFAQTMAFLSRRTVNEMGPVRQQMMQVVLANIKTIMVSQSIVKSSNDDDDGKRTAATRVLIDALTAILQNDVQKRDTVLKAFFLDLGACVLSTAVTSDRTTSDITTAQAWITAATQWSWIVALSSGITIDQFSWPTSPKYPIFLSPPSADINDDDDDVLRQLQIPVNELKRRGHNSKATTTTTTTFTPVQVVNMFITSLESVYIKQQPQQQQQQPQQQQQQPQQQQQQQQRQPISPVIGNLPRLATLFSIASYRWSEVQVLVDALAAAVAPFEYNNKPTLEQWTFAATLYTQHARNAMRVRTQCIQLTDSMWSYVTALTDATNVLTKFVLSVDAETQQQLAITSEIGQQWAHTWLVMRRRQAQYDVNALRVFDSHPFVRSCLFECIIRSRTPNLPCLPQQKKVTVVERDTVGVQLADELCTITPSAVYLDVVQDIYSRSRDDRIADILEKSTTASASFTGLFAPPVTDKTPKYPIEYLNQRVMYRIRASALRCYGDMCLTNVRSVDLPMTVRTEWLVEKMALWSTSARDMVRLFVEFENEPAIVETIIMKLFTTDHYWNVITYLLRPSTWIDAAAPPPTIQRTVANLLSRLVAVVRADDVIHVLRVLLEPRRRKSLIVLLHKRVIELLFTIATTSSTVEEAVSVLLRDECRHMVVMTTDDSSMHKHVLEEMVRQATNRVWMVLDGRGDDTNASSSLLLEVCWEILFQVVTHNTNAEWKTIVLLFAPHWHTYTLNNNSNSSSNVRPFDVVSLACPSSFIVASTNAASVEQRQRLTDTDNAFFNVMNAIIHARGVCWQSCALTLKLDRISWDACARYGELLCTLASSLPTVEGDKMITRVLRRIAVCYSWTYNVPALQGKMNETFSNELTTITSSLPLPTTSSVVLVAPSTPKHVYGAENTLDALEMFVLKTAASLNAAFAAHAAHQATIANGPNCTQEAYVERCADMPSTQQLRTLLHSTVDELFTNCTAAQVLRAGQLKFIADGVQNGMNAYAGVVTRCYFAVAIVDDALMKKLGVIRVFGGLVNQVFLEI